MNLFNSTRSCVIALSHEAGTMNGVSISYMVHKSLLRQAPNRRGDSTLFLFCDETDLEPPRHPLYGEGKLFHLRIS